MTMKYNPASSDARVTLTSYEDPGSSLHDALLNPNTLSISVEASVGELYPVGGSHTVLQYGHTKSIDVPLELYFSNQLTNREKVDIHDSMMPVSQPDVRENVMQHVNWLMSFCYASEEGKAPSPLLIVWPKVLNIVAIVKSCRVEYVRFARDLAPTAARVSMNCAELRYSFKGNEEQLKYGFLKRDPLAVSGGTGYPLNMHK